MTHSPIKIIDLFAGPGGLGEGFSSIHHRGRRFFHICTSVEHEASAHKTLTLRAFFRQFFPGKAPEDYYAYVRGEMSRAELFDAWPDEAGKALEETLGVPHALGEDNDAIDRAISRCLKGDRNWVLIGGPPCQAYSLVGRARNRGVKGYRPEDDHRHFLYREYLRIIAKFDPAVFVMENVKGMLSARVGGKSVFQEILSDLEHPAASISKSDSGSKYHVFSFTTDESSVIPGTGLCPADYVIKAEEYGIPQTRHRVILLGVRTDLARNLGSYLLEKRDSPVLESVVGDLPSLRSGLSKSADSASAWKKEIADLHARLSLELLGHPELQDVRDLLDAARRATFIPKADRGGRYLPFEPDADPYRSMPEYIIDWYRDERLHGYLNHSTRGHIVPDLARYLFCAAYAQRNSGQKNRSPRLADFPSSLLPAHSNAKSGKFVDRFRVQLRDRPASTITSHISRDGHYYIHYDPTQARSLTVRESARIQTFPDNYFFEGSRTQQYVQVGNAVPPLLANRIAHVVARLMKA